MTRSHYREWVKILGGLILDRLQFRKTIINGVAGFDLKVKSGNASVQDLLDAMNDFIENGAPARLWPPDSRSSCCGCDLCCHEPLPVTAIDAENIARALQLDFISVFKYLRVEVQANVVDITLQRKNMRNCIFLQKDGKCSIYKVRPFLCQTYICCQNPESMNELRSQIANQGMDELVRKAIMAFKARGKDLPVSRGTSRHIDLADWPRNCFTAKKTYSELLLKNVLSSDLLRVLLI